MAANSRNRQSGAFILVTVVFLMVVGSIFIYSMTNLSTVASSTTGVVHNSNAALAAAQSGLKYCLYDLGNGGTCLVYTPGFSPSTCTIAFTPPTNCTTATPTCMVYSKAICGAGSTEQAEKWLEVQVTYSAISGYQMIPASLRPYPH